MKNANPIYLIEGFWRKFSDLRNAKKHLKTFTGKGKELVDDSLRMRRGILDGTRTHVERGLELGRRFGKFTDETKTQYMNDVDKYLDAISDWRTAKSDLWGETKALPGRAWDSIKGIFKKNPPTHPPISYKNSNHIMPYAVGAGGLGLLGFKTIADTIPTSEVQDIKDI